MVVKLNFENSKSLLSGLNSTISSAHNIFEERIINLTNKITKSLNTHFDTTSECIDSIFSKVPKHIDLNKEFNEVSTLRLKLVKEIEDINIGLSQSEMQYREKTFQKIEESYEHLSLLANKLNEINNVDKYVVGTTKRIKRKNNIKSEIRNKKIKIIKEIQDSKIGKIVEIFQLIVFGLISYYFFSLFANFSRSILKELVGKITLYIKISKERNLL